MIPPTSPQAGTKYRSLPNAAVPATLFGLPGAAQCRTTRAAGALVALAVFFTTGTAHAPVPHCVEIQPRNFLGEAYMIQTIDDPVFFYADQVHPSDINKSVWCASGRVYVR